jgi:hypothetical protein
VLMPKQMVGPSWALKADREVCDISCDGYGRSDRGLGLSLGAVDV